MLSPGWRLHAASYACDTKLPCMESGFPCIMKVWPAGADPLVGPAGECLERDPATCPADDSSTQSRLAATSSAPPDAIPGPNSENEPTDELHAAIDATVQRRKPASGLSAALKRHLPLAAASGPRLSVRVPSRGKLSSSSNAAPATEHATAGRPPLPPHQTQPPPRADADGQLGRTRASRCSGASGGAAGAVAPPSADPTHKSIASAAAAAAPCGSTAAVSAASSPVSDEAAWDTPLFFSPSVVDRLWAGHASPAASGTSSQQLQQQSRRDQGTHQAARSSRAQHHPQQQQQQHLQQRGKAARDGLAWFRGLSGGRDVTPASSRATAGGGGGGRCTDPESEEEELEGTTRRRRAAGGNRAAPPPPPSYAAARGAADAATPEAASLPCMSLVAAAAAAAPAPMALGSACSHAAGACGCVGCGGGGSCRLAQWGSGVVSCKLLESDTTAAAANAVAAGAPGSKAAVVPAPDSGGSGGGDGDAAWPSAQVGFALAALAPCSSADGSAQRCDGSGAGSGGVPGSGGAAQGYAYAFEGVRGTVHNGPRMPLGESPANGGTQPSCLRQQLRSAQHTQLRQQQERRRRQAVEAWLAERAEAHTPGGGGGGVGGGEGGGAPTRAGGEGCDAGRIRGGAGGSGADTPLSQASTVWGHSAAPGANGPPAPSRCQRGGGGAAAGGGGIDGRTQWWDVTGRFQESVNAAVQQGLHLYQDDVCSEFGVGGAAQRRRGAALWRLLGLEW